MRFISFTLYDERSGMDRTVVKKSYEQVRALVDLGIDASLVIVGPNKVWSDSFVRYYETSVNQEPGFLMRIKRRIASIGILRDVTADLGYSDILYMRYHPILAFYLAVFMNKKRRYKIVVECNTKDLEEFKLQRSYGYLLAEILLGRQIRRCIDGLVGVTDEITSYQMNRSGDPQKPKITMGNGIDVSSIKMRSPPPLQSNSLNLLFVGNVSYWHGLDRVLKGLEAYHGGVNLCLHIVGGGEEMQQLKDMADKMGLKNKVFFPGFLSGDDLDKYFDSCHIALGTSGIHRIGMKQASVLKAREYCVRGIPFVLGYSDPDFPKSFPYILEIPAEDGPINMSAIVRFAQNVCFDPDHHIIMRRYAQDKLDWRVKMNILAQFCKSLTRPTIMK
jgi:glycosyltransferase involved in cell wall biosynthesis